MKSLDLGGKWSVGKVGGGLPATVPGCMHSDLLAAGRIDDPFCRENEEKQFWIRESAWVYRRSFIVMSDLIVHRRVLLVCEGLDTLATISSNGRKVAAKEHSSVSHRRCLSMYSDAMTTGTLASQMFAACACS